MIAFSDYTKKARSFFAFLPPDWRAEIVPHWSAIRSSVAVYVLAEEGEILAGGMVFSSVSPDTRAYRTRAMRLFGRGCLYIGYLYVASDRRGRGLGSRWLKELFRTHPGQSYWLSVEEEGLVDYYARAGFQLQETVDLPTGREWILVRV